MCKQALLGQSDTFFQNMPVIDVHLQSILVLRVFVHSEILGGVSGKVLFLHCLHRTQYIAKMQLL